MYTIHNRTVCAFQFGWVKCMVQHTIVQHTSFAHFTVSVLLWSDRVGPFMLKLLKCPPATLRWPPTHTPYTLHTYCTLQTAHILHTAHYSSAHCTLLTHCTLYTAHILHTAHSLHTIHQIHTSHCIAKSCTLHTAYSENKKDSEFSVVAEYCMLVNTLKHDLNTLPTS